MMLNEELDDIASSIAFMINKYASKEDSIKLKKSFGEIGKDLQLLSMANYVLYHGLEEKAK